jgi:glutaconate CoA-transferase subunit B
MSDYTPGEIMTIEAARRLKNGTVCFVGIGMPSAAANLARLTHAPDVVLIYESGTIGAKPDVLRCRSAMSLAEHADTVVSVRRSSATGCRAARDVGSGRGRSIDSATSTPPSSAATVRSPRCACRARGRPEIASTRRKSGSSSSREAVGELDSSRPSATSTAVIQAKSGARGEADGRHRRHGRAVPTRPRESSARGTSSGITIEQAKASWADLGARSLAQPRKTPMRAPTLRDLHAHGEGAGRSQRSSSKSTTTLKEEQQ